VIKVEIILSLIAASVAILAFMARAYANIRRGQRIKRYSQEISTGADREFQQLQEELHAAGEMTERKRKRRRPRSR
jgi:hypothetical protein